MAGNTKQLLPIESVDLTEAVQVIKLSATPIMTLLNGNTVPATSKIVNWREVTLLDSVKAPSLEGADAGDGGTHGRVNISNNCMILSDEFTISGTVTAVGVVGNIDEVEFETDLKLKEIMLNAEHYAINGVLANETATIPSQANGLLNLISQNNHQNLGGTTALTETHLITALETMYLMGVDITEERICYVNSAMKKKLNELYKANKTGVIVDGVGQTIGTTADKIVSDYGTARIVLDEKMPNNTVAFVAPSFLELAMLRPFTRVALGKTGDGQKYQIVGEFSFKLLNQYAGAVIAGIQ